MKVTRQQLDAADRETRVSGLDWASLLCDPGIRTRVAGIARGGDVKGRRPDEDEVWHALVALAHLGPDEELVDALQLSGGRTMRRR